MKLQSGNLQINGQLAIATQIPWIYNDTLKENIIVGNEMNRKKYEEVIKVCALESDLQLLSNGDMTEIGERGINLRYLIYYHTISLMHVIEG